jgi:hypothetical protein
VSWAAVSESETKRKGRAGLKVRGKRFGLKEEEEKRDLEGEG